MEVGSGHRDSADEEMSSGDKARRKSRAPQLALVQKARETQIPRLQGMTELVTSGKNWG